MFVAIEPRALRALLGEHVSHHLGVSDRTAVRQHPVHAGGDHAVVGTEQHRAERAAAACLDVAPRQLDRQRDLVLVGGIGRRLVERVMDPGGQGEVDLCVQHGVRTQPAAQVSRRVTLRLNTGLPGAWSRRSATK